MLIRIASLVNPHGRSLDISARMQVEERKFVGEKGVLFVYQLRITNYIDKEKLFIIPCFISLYGKYNSRISKYFQEVQVRARDLIEIEQVLDWEMIRKNGKLNSERLAETIYFEQAIELNEKLRKQEESRQMYFQAHKSALMRIAVENIRNARLQELQEEIAAFQTQSKKRRQLIPSLNCEQIAYVEFV